MTQLSRSVFVLSLSMLVMSTSSIWAMPQSNTAGSAGKNKKAGSQDVSPAQDQSTKRNGEAKSKRKTPNSKTSQKKTKQSKDKFSPDKSLVYKSVDGVKLQLDVFLPKGHDKSTQAPAVVFFFGGGWNGGTTRQFYEQAKYVNQFGIVAFSADYRVRSKHKTTPFECVADGKSAVRWVRKHASDFGINPEQIVAAGGSAGGHVAACTGLVKEFDDPSEDASVSSIPNAMILFNPVLDTTKKGYGNERFDKKNETKISPCHQIREGIVPTLLFHGTKDTTVPFENAERFARLMKDAKNRCDLVGVKGAGHGFFNGRYFRPNIKSDEHFQNSMQSSIAFLRSLKYLPESDAKK